MRRPGAAGHTLLAMTQLLVRLESNREQAAALGQEPVAIGRHPDNTLVLHDDRASRFHCVIEPQESGRWLLRDLGSRNGTWLNDELVRSATLAVGDVIRVGSTRLVVEEAPAENGLLGLRQQRAHPLSRSRRSSRAGASDDTHAPGAPATAGPAWAASLEETLRALPSVRDESGMVTLVDASGADSDALLGSGQGSLAFRLIIRVAERARATDIHIEPKAEDAQVRMRLDGEMVTVAELPRAVFDKVLGLVRTVCQLRVANPREVLDGHFAARFGSSRVDYRASFTPSVHGHKLVIRVLDARNAPRSLNQLGLPPLMHEAIRKLCSQNAGMLLVSGPTGSGKTTTLHNAMREIDREKRNVITIEDPVEYHVEGVTQIPVDAEKGVTFESMLRSVLRQDPDVIMVGEIRDVETARTAMQAAMTGHVVLTTVHAKDTLGSIFRLLNLGVEPYLVANSLNIVLAQRLVRVLCDRCKKPAPLKPGQIVKMGRIAQGATKAYTPVGCSRCLQTGYLGRRAIFEMLQVADDLRDVIMSEPTIHAMKQVVEQGVFTTLAQSGWKLVVDGVTSMEEIERVVGEG